MGLISRVSSRTYKPQKNKIKMGMPRNGEYVQVYGRKKTATAVALCKAGKGLIKVNGRPLDKIEPEALRLKLEEPLLVCGQERFSAIDIKSKSAVVDELLKSTLSDKPSLGLLSPTTKNTSTSTPNES